MQTILQRACCYEQLKVGTHAHFTSPDAFVFLFPWLRDEDVFDGRFHTACCRGCVTPLCRCRERFNACQRYSNCGQEGAARETTRSVLDSMHG